MIENIANHIKEENDELDVIGNYNPEVIDNPQKNSLHPEAMSEDQIERYGMCHSESRKFARENGGEVYTTSNRKHSIAVKNGKVFDYVLGYNLDISLEEYLDKVPYLFEKMDKNT
jgi:endo-alpha-1,4-polygalactosaminidase (GH114 family)